MICTAGEEVTGIIIDSVDKDVSEIPINAEGKNNHLFFVTHLGYRLESAG